jgi:ring-1,2-phenylacetyl-CoA epoxidase subunit PaaE
MSPHFHPLTVTEVRRETPDAVSLRFELPDALRDTFRFKAGQYLTLKTELAGEEIRRNYSLCVSPVDQELRVAIKQIPGGAFSTYANSELKAGDTLDVMPPGGSFVWDMSGTQPHHYVGFAGGSGITPILSLLKTALATESASQFTLLYGNRNSQGVIFLEELAALKDRYLDRLQVLHFLEDEVDEIDLLNGRLDRAKCDELLSTFIDPSAITAFFICGPGPMMDAAEQSLLAFGVPAGQIFVERFSAGDLTPAQAAAAKQLEEQASGLKLTVTLEGRRHIIAFDAKAGNILDSAREAGLPAPYACKGGVCATCRAKVVSGHVEMKRNYGLTDEEVAAGFILTCQSIPVGEGVVIEYEN